MSDNNERNVNNEDIYESRDVKNGMPQLDEEQYNQVEQKNKNMRSSISEDDDYQETYEEEDNDIINSLLNSAKSKKEEDSGVTKNVKNKLYKEGKSIFGKKKEIKNETSDDIYESQPLTSESFDEQKDDENVSNNSSVSNDFNSDNSNDEPAKKEKKKSLFGKNKKEKNSVNTEPPSSYSDNDNDDNIINVHDDEKVNTFEDIERTARMAKTKKGGFKGLLIVFGVVVVVGALFVGGTYLINTLKPTEKPPVVEQPEEIVTPDDDFVSTDNQSTLYKQGIIKRILGNKVLIVPDGEKENTIYYVDNDKVIAKYKAGAHIEYGYVIRNYLPYITEAVAITEGQVIYKGIMTLNIMMDDTLVKFAYDASLEEDVKKIITGDTLQYVYEVIDGTYTITNIINVKNLASEEDDEGPDEPGNFGNGQIFDPKEFYNEYIIIDSRGDESDDRVTVSSNIENNTIAFYSSLTGPIWIRHAWRSTDIMETVPSIDAIDVVLVLPDGTQVTSTNIDKYGRMWLDGNIINYAFKNPQVGEYKIIDNKASGTFLGEAMIHVMELSGFITIDKFGANLIDRDTLELIWNIGGVPDDGLEIEVYLTNDRFSTMVYKGSSKEEPLHIIDKRTVSVSNLPRGQYNIIVKVKDIDMKTTADDPEIPVNAIQITAETITETKNVGILTIQ